MASRSSLIKDRARLAQNAPVNGAQLPPPATGRALASHPIHARARPSRSPRMVCGRMPKPQDSVTWPKRSSPALPHRRPGSSISAARAPRCSTGSTRAATAAACCCASRTRTGNARRPRRSPPSWRAWRGSVSKATAQRSTSFSGLLGIARSPRACSQAVMPTAATPARASSTRCANRLAPKSARRATTAAGATATRRRRPLGSRR